MAQFLNPNAPPQPTAGVYEWFYEHDGRRVSLYIGQAGQKESPTPASTLFRGIQQLAQKTFSSDGQGRRLDTDFVVGCAIKFVEQRLGTQCKWEHISSDALMENSLCRARRPQLQNHETCSLFADLKCIASDNRWYIAGTAKTLEEKRLLFAEAEKAVWGILAKYVTK